MTQEEAEGLYNFFNLIRQEYNVNGPSVIKLVVSSLKHTRDTQGVVDTMQENLNKPLELTNISKQKVYGIGESVVFTLRIKNRGGYTTFYYDYRDVVYSELSKDTSPLPNYEKETFKFDINNLSNF